MKAGKGKLNSETAQIWWEEGKKKGEREREREREIEQCNNKEVQKKKKNH